MHKTQLCFFCALCLGLGGCEKRAAPPFLTNRASFDVCDLITKEEIEQAQGSPIISSKNSASSNEGLRVSQCFYAAQEFSRSVSLSLRQADPSSPAKRSPKEFWKETFGQYEREENAGDEEKRESLREHKREEGEIEPASPPEKIADVGDQAYWVADRVGGALYILKGDAIVRISVGGPDDQRSKLKKCKALGERALARL
jgi:hypothetical protein